MASFTAPWKSATPGPTMADARTESLPHSPKWRLLAAEELARPGQMRLQPVRRGAWVVDLRWVDIDVRAARALQHLPEGLVGKRLLDVLAGRRGHRSIFDHYRRVLETGVPEVAAYDLGVAMLAAPLLVWLGASWNPAPALAHASRVLGELSYPVYAIHYPALWMFGFVARKAGVPALVWMPAFVVLIAAAAWLALVRFDQPVRARLGRLAARGGRSVQMPST